MKFGFDCGFWGQEKTLEEFSLNESMENKLRLEGPIFDPWAIVWRIHKIKLHIQYHMA